MNILITGSNGQLGSEIKDIAPDFPQFNFIYADLPELDICNFTILNNFVKKHNINSIINCAAYTAVDRAEEDKEVAEKVNVEGVANLANAMEAVNGKLIHISTDYVFDGDHFMPYSEKDKEVPIGVYGITKRDGEKAVLKSNVDGIVIRTSWLYSAYGNNFVKTMLRLGKDRDELNVIFDQVGTPTFAGDLAKTCLDILSSNDEKINRKGKIYHFSNEGVASWYDFAIAIMQMGNVECEVSPIETKDYPTLAKRPHYSVLNKTKIKKDFDIKIPYWRDSLEMCIQKLKKV